MEGGLHVILLGMIRGQLGIPPGVPQLGGGHGRDDHAVRSTRLLTEACRHLGTHTPRKRLFDEDIGPLYT